MKKMVGFYKLDLVNQIDKILILNFGDYCGLEKYFNLLRIFNG